MAKDSSQDIFIPDLITIVKYEPDIQIKTKAVSDLARADDMDLVMAYAFLKKITTQSGYEPLVYDSAVQDKANEVMSTLKTRVMALPNYAKRPELQKLVLG